MKKILMAILCSLLFISLSTSAATKQSTQAPETPTHALQSSPATPDISTDLKLQQQKLEFFKDRLDLQDKRIGDLTFFLTLSLACFGVLMTVIVVFFSLRSTKEAVLSAKEEARKEVEVQAKTIIETWLSKEGQPLLEQKVEDTLRPEVDKALDDIREEQRKAHDHNSKQEQLNAQHEKKISELTALIVDKDKPLSDEQRKTVDDAAKELDTKPPKEYRFEDWFMLGVQAFESAKYESAADRFSKAAENTTVPIFQASALINKGVSLNQMKQSEEAGAVYDEVVRLFGDATDVELLSQVATAYIGIGFNLLCKAKKAWKDGDKAVGTAFLIQALATVEKSLELNPDEPITLGNQGYILFLLGRREEALPILARAIVLGGEKLRQVELEDADIHTLPQDDAFRELIRSL